jgi:NADPH-dependent 2,4-dienoyl-CoA reductase/sulfur reductase-like enzyme
VTGVRCVEMELGKADESGRRRPVPKPGSEVLIEADHVIVAIGQGPDLDFALSHGQVVISEGRLNVHPVTQRSGEGRVFGGGDAVTGPSTIIEAVAAGQRAAQAIDALLGGSGELPPDRGFAPRAKPDEEAAAVARHAISHKPPAERIVDFEEAVEGYCAEIACREACRCLRCDLEE